MLFDYVVGAVGSQADRVSRVGPLPRNAVCPVHVGLKYALGSLNFVGLKPWVVWIKPKELECSINALPHLLGLLPVPTLKVRRVLYDRHRQYAVTRGSAAPRQRRS